MMDFFTFGMGMLLAFGLTVWGIKFYADYLRYKELKDEEYEKRLRQTIEKRLRQTILDEVKKVIMRLPKVKAEK